MDKRVQNIDDLFKDALGDYAEAPPPAAWSALDKKLDAAKRPAVFGGNKRVWLASLIGLLFFSGILLVQQYKGFLMHGSSKEVAAITETTANATQPVGAQTGDIKTTVSRQGTETNIQTDGKSAPGNRQPETRIAEKTSENNNIKSESRHWQTNNSTNTLNNKKTAVNKSIKKPAGKTTTADNNGAGEQYDKPIPVVYNSTSSLPAQANDADASDNSTEKANAQSKTETQKKTTSTSAAVKEKPKLEKKPKVKYSRFELGIKAGYERGFDNDAAKKIVVSPYVQLNISPKFSFMLQPSVKQAWLGSRRIGNTATYYRANNDSVVVAGPTNNIYPAGDTTVILTKTNYSYSQTHDSIVKSNKIGGNYLEVEIPLLLKYYVNKKFSVYAGVNLTYSKLTQVTENTYIKASIPTGPIDTYVIARPGETPVAPSVNSVITFKGNPYSNYSGPQYPTPEESSWRAGYMAGFSYEFSKRILFDCLIQQAKTKTNVQSGYNINTSQSAPYIRFTLGYKLTK